MDILTTIMQPVLTEKSTVKQEKGQYTFYVRKEATKIDVENAFKLMFGEKPGKIRIINLPKKTRLIGRGRKMTKRGNIKKAIVFTKKGKKIDINKFKI